MSIEAVARRYARAVYELGKEQKKLTALNRELAAFAQAYSDSAEFREAAHNPLLDDDARDAIIGQLGKRLAASDMTVRTVRLLARRSRLPVLPDLVRQLSELVDEHEGIVRASVQSASHLSPAYLDKLKKKLEGATGKKVVITFSEDPSLIAGVVTQIGDRVIDGSVRGRLAQLRESLRET